MKSDTVCITTDIELNLEEISEAMSIQQLLDFYTYNLDTLLEDHGFIGEFLEKFFHAVTVHKLDNFVYYEFRKAFKEKEESFPVTKLLNAIAEYNASINASDEEELNN